MPLEVDLHTVREAIDSAPWGQRGAVVENYADLFGVKTDTLYKQLRDQLGQTRQRKSVHKYPKELINEIARIKMRGLLLTKGASVQREPSTENCIDIMIDEGFAGAEALREIDTLTGKVKYKTATMNARLVKAGFRLPDPKERIEAEYANQQWQFDFSRSKYFQIFDSEDGRWMVKISGKELHYKLDDTRMRNWVVQAKDELARIRRIQYYPAAGESWMIGLDFLNQIFLTPADDPHPMIYLPDALKCDQGAFRKKKQVQASLKAYGIADPSTTPGNHDSQGKVESGFRSLWQSFELKIATQVGAGAVMYLEDLNALVHEFTVKEMEKEHPLKCNMTRGEVYLDSIAFRPQRRTTEDMRDHAYKVEERTVDQMLLFSWQGKKYRAPAWAACKRVRVSGSLSGDVIVESIDKHKHTAVAIPPKEGENYPYRKLGDFDHREHATYRQKIETEVEAQTRDIKRARKGKGNQIYMPPLEREIVPDSPASRAERQASGMDVDSDFATAREAKLWINGKIALMSEGHQGYADFAEEFDSLISATLDRARIEVMVEKLRAAYRQENMQLLK